MASFKLIHLPIFRVGVLKAFRSEVAVPARRNLRFILYPVESVGRHVLPLSYIQLTARRAHQLSPLVEFKVVRRKEPSFRRRRSLNPIKCFPVPFPQRIKSAHIDFVVNDVTEGMLETAGKDLVFKLDGNKLALRVVGFFIPRRRVERLVGQLLVMAPKTDDLNGFNIGQDLVDQSVLDVDSPRIGPRQIAHQFFKGRGIVEGVGFHYFQEYFGFGFKASRDQFLGIYLGLLRIQELPVHQFSFFESLPTGVLSPVRIDSRIPGIETK